MDNPKINPQQDYWNTYGVTKTFNHPINFQQLNELINKDARILDYGCGYGRVSNILYKHGYKNITGVDFSESMIAKGRNLYPSLNLNLLSSFSLPFADGDFDAVLLFTVLTCIPANENQIQLIQELERILNKEGLLYISDLCLQSNARNMQRYQKYQDKYGVYGIFELSDGAVLRHHDRSWIDSLTSNFTQVSWDEFDVMTMNNNHAKAFQLFAQKNRS